MPVDRLPPIPKVPGACPDCGKPSLTLYCDACAPPPASGPFAKNDLAPGSQGIAALAFRHNGRPVYGANRSY